MLPFFKQRMAFVSYKHLATLACITIGRKVAGNSRYAVGQREREGEKWVAKSKRFQLNPSGPQISLCHAVKRKGLQPALLVRPIFPLLATNIWTQRFPCIIPGYKSPIPIWIQAIMTAYREVRRNEDMGMLKTFLSNLKCINKGGQNYNHLLIYIYIINISTLQ